jgi:L-asparaginase
MFILNTGGTFNKRYDPISGHLSVPYDNQALESIVSRFASEVTIAGAIYKDSLEFTRDDRAMMANIVMASDEKKVLIIHGTDTMRHSAAYFSELFEDRVIVFTGAMVPYEIDSVEATANFAMAMGYLQAEHKAGVYICMQGLIAPWEHIEKNRATGRFEIVQG